MVCVSRACVRLRGGCVWSTSVSLTTAPSYRKLTDDPLSRHTHTARRTSLNSLTLSPSPSPHMSRHTTLKAPALSLGATSPGGSSVAGASPRGPALSAVELLAAAASTWSSSGGSPFSLASASSNSKSPLVLSFQNGHHHHHYDGGNHIVCERCLLLSTCTSADSIRSPSIRFDSIRWLVISYTGR